MTDIILNYFFFIFHTVLILFNCFGWIVPRLRKWNLIVLLLTAFSWFVLGIWYGRGYCVRADSRYAAPHGVRPPSICGSPLHLLRVGATRVSFASRPVHVAAAAVLCRRLAVSVWLNTRDFGRNP